MADPDSNSDTGDDTRVRPDRGSPPSTPRWVKVFGIIVIVLVLLVVGLMIFGGGEHGPSRHTPGGDTPGAVDGATAPDVQVPAGLQVSTSGYTLSPISAPEAAEAAGWQEIDATTTTRNRGEHTHG